MRKVMLSRRNVLKSGSALSLTLLAGPGLSQDLEVKTDFLLLEGLDHGFDPSIAAQILDIFFSHGVPLCIGIEEFDTDAVRENAGLSGFLQLAADVALRQPGLVELAPVFTPSTSKQRYFQLRAASELRRRLAMSPLGDVMGGQIANIVTVLDRSDGNTVNPYALRAAGFRVLIREAPTTGGRTDEGTTLSSPDWGLMNIEGMTSVSIFDNARDGLETLFKKKGSQLLKISFAGAEQRQSREIISACEVWAGELRDALGQAKAFIARPADHLLRGNPGASKYLALLLDQRGGANESMAAFARELEALDFPYSLLSSSAEAAEETLEQCIVGSEDFGDSAPDCVFLDQSHPTPKEISANIVIYPPGSSNAWTGQRSDARFQISLPEPDFRDLATRHKEDPTTDQVEMVSPRQVETDFQRRALLRHLQELRWDGRAHFHSIRGFMEQILSPEPALERLWSVRKRLANEQFDQISLGPSETEDMKFDARLAWRYIEKFTNRETGICAGTATVRSRNQDVTLWDVASQIFGILSAWRIGFVQKSDAIQRSERLLSNLPTASVGELQLPPSIFRADTLRTVFSEYDACDAGRFLLALDALTRSGLVSREVALATIDQWDLGATVRDGRVFSFSRGSWSDVTLSHCTPYTTQGYAAWGMEVQSPYPTIEETSTGDDQMRLLHRAAFLGPYGAEPLLLAAVERGLTPEFRFLSDVLFDAQLTWFEDTGKLRSVSETALNINPWFIYQGLRVDRTGPDAWVTGTKSGEAKYQTPEFMALAEVISTKSAYLWVAAYPHPYSNRLVALVREKARIEDHGFSSGIYARTLEAMEGYSDLNTNGIILTAIAKILVP